MMNKTTRGIAACALTAALGMGGLFAGAAPALADPAAAEQGTITVTTTEGNAGVSYSAIQIIKADVDSAGKATHITWASDEVKAAVEGAIRAEDPAYAGTTAQDAADFIAAHIAGTNSTTILANTDFGNKLADAVDGIAGTAVAAGTASTLDEGWWLLVTDGSSLGTGAAGTSPIFALINKDVPVSITEKVSVPTVQKEIKEDSTGEWGTIADSAVGQDVDYRLTGTVSGNIATFDTYSYKFNDLIDDGLTLDGTSSVRVTVDDVDVTDQADIKLVGQRLTVSFDNLKALDGVTVDADTTVVVTYTAHLNDAVAIGEPGNKNTVRIEYSNNPNHEGTGTTVEKTVKDFAFGFTIVKKDKVTDALLAGAKFTIKDSAGKYVQEDGSMGDEPFEFTTDEYGEISVIGLDADTYTIEETATPTGYEQIDTPITVTLVPEYDAEQIELTSLSATFSGGEGDGVDADGDGLVESGSGITYIEYGNVYLDITNDKQIVMPVTGLDGITFTYVAGGATLAISLAGLALKGLRKEQ